MKEKQANPQDFKRGNVKNRRIDLKDSLPEASRFTEPDQNKHVKQRPQLY